MRETLGALLRAFLAHAGRRRVAIAITTIVGGALLEGIGLAMLVPLLAVLSGSGGDGVQDFADQAFRRIGADDQIGRAAVLLSLFVILILARAVVLARRDAVLMRLELGFISSQRTALLAALGRARWSRIAALRHSRVLQALDGDVERSALSLHLLLQLVTSVTMLTIQGLIVLWIAPAMAGFAVALITLGGAVLLPLLRRAGNTGRSIARHRAELSHGTAQLLAGLKLAVAQNLQNAFIAEYETVAEVMTAERLELMSRFSRSRITGTTIGALAGAVIVLVGIALGTPVLSLIAAVAVFTRMVGPVTTIGQSAQQIAGSMPSYGSLDALRRELTNWRGADEDHDALPRRAPVRFEQVTYLHDAQNGVQDLSLTIVPSEIIGVIGSSGAGKTTFVDLLAGLLEPQTGAIRIGEVPLAGATAAWRDRISYVGQDSYLFNDTLRRNLTLGLSVVDDVAIWNALRLVGADAFVRAVPDGLETVVAERGARLSGGQRQRIALARAVLRRPDLMILDEATNAIDIAGEAAIFDALAELSPRPTIIVVAHRAETLRTCDRLLRFADGRLTPELGAGGSSSLPTEAARLSECDDAAHHI